MKKISVSEHYLEEALLALEQAPFSDNDQYYRQVAAIEGIIKAMRNDNERQQ